MPLNLVPQASPANGIFSGEGVSGNTFEASEPGSYEITYTKTFNGTCAFSKTFNVNVDAAPSMSLTLISSPDECDAEGSFQITGPAGADYSTSPDIGSGTFDGSGTATVTGVAGFYTVYVDATCVVSDTITIPSADGALSATVDVSEATCSGANSGTITVNAVNGTPPYAYSLDGVNFQSSNVFSNLPAGDYTVTVDDASECISVFTLGDISIIELTPVDLSVEFYSDPTCFGSNNGVIENLQAVGGDGGPYTYSLDNGDFTSNTTFNGLSGGAHTITVMDNSGCEAEFVFSLEEPAPIVLVFDQVSADSNSVIVDANYSGGTGILVIKRNAGAFTTDTIFDLTYGVSYTFTVKDQNGCTFDTTFTLSDPDGIGEISATDFVVYPNPFENNITISGNYAATSVKMIDVYGKTVAVSVTKVNGNMVIDTDNLAKGMYLINIIGDGYNVTKKVIKN